MATSRTIKFLPEVFRTDSNKKFLTATLDQLIAEPDFKKVNGFIGRKFAPTHRPGDNYVTESSADRQNYQLEPTAVIKNKSGDVEFISNYNDLLQQIDFYGGNTNNHSRLFSNSYYSFTSFVDFDKLVNFNNYYWLPDGPADVQVFSGSVDSTAEFVIAKDRQIAGFSINGEKVANPELKLARGGAYTFKVNQPGAKFWIQTEPGTSGTYAARPTLSTRNVFGVKNNGTDAGTVTFNVPLQNEQNFYTTMPLTATVDFATTLTYTQLQNETVDNIVALGGIDGFKGELNNKTLIFVGTNTDDADWTTEGIFDYTGVEGVAFDNGNIVPTETRCNVWRITIVDVNGSPIVTLLPITQVNALEKIYVKAGATNANATFYKEAVNLFYTVPDITSQLDTLYYQDSSNPGYVGIIKLVDPSGYNIDITNDILGQKNYTSPNGVVFTNGLKITFDTAVTPSTYANNSYYVEGVGTSIRLIKVSDLEPIELGNTDTFDFITINRSSIDQNPWSRSNRWFHKDVIEKTAAYRGEIPVYDQTKVARRGIIEFDADLQLFNFGRIGKPSVDILNLNSSNAFNEIEGHTSAVVDGITLVENMRVVFANDIDPLVKNKIYVVKFEEINHVTQIHLVVADDGNVQTNTNLMVKLGTSASTSVYYNGTDWIITQQKSSVNQYPLFDVFDEAGDSFSNAKYGTSSFLGTKIFTYKEGTGNIDPVLGFPLSYLNFSNFGDIEFLNVFDSDTYEYLDQATPITVKINTGYLGKIKDANTLTDESIWTTVEEPTRQYQILSFTYTGATSYFEVDVTPVTQSEITYTKLFIDNKLYDQTYYKFVNVKSKRAVKINKNILSVGSKIDLLVYSKEVSNNGYYEIPTNLNYNALNQNFSALTLGQLRNHYNKMIENTSALASGAALNLRDLNLRSKPGNILQQSAPSHISNLFLCSEEFNFVNGLETASREYTRFKNKFLELSTQLQIDVNNPVASTDTLLAAINDIKNIEFPWYYSDMVPYGDNKTEYVYTVFNPQLRYYEISSVFNDTVLSNRAVLVYLNGKQLVKDIDYTFSSIQNAVHINTTVTLAVDDTIRLVEYPDTDGNYIPETPSKLGLYPKFVPSKYRDTTYQTPIDVIRGHDGSIIPAFGDFRDDLLLELENRIYNNIKLDPAKQASFWAYVPGKFRNTYYSLKEYNQILTQSFLQWVGSNRIDYTTNDYFISSDPWTYNYKKFKDNVTGEFLPGTWRAVFNYFYDTDRPHTHPWEMLGLSQQPTWWEDRYGPAPYTSGNLVLWEDLAKGYVYGEGRYDVRFIRPALLSIIPVNEYGELRPPSEFAVAEFSSSDANQNYSIGDQGPAETAWRRSSEYPFAVQRAIALMKPAIYFGLFANVDKYFINPKTGQYIQAVDRSRIKTSDILVNGRTSTLVTSRTAGYINWISDYQKSLGIMTTDNLLTSLANLNVQLSYKMGGFSDKKFLTITAEQASPTSVSKSFIIPTENFNLLLNKSTPIKKITYSGVVIERSTGGGFTVSGYDLGNPYFTIIPSLPNNNAYSFDVNGEKGVVYKDFQQFKLNVPYGYEFNSKQQVVDFLVSYQRYLISQGFIFNEYNTDLGERQDWVLSAKEFITWSQQGWKTGNIVVLSPALNSLKVLSTSGVVDSIKNSYNGSRIVNQNYNVIGTAQMSVARTDNNCTVSVDEGQTIGFAELHLVQYEHILVFDNVTVFNDIIYKPEIGSRQFRLKLVGNKTGSWSGALSAPGFMYNSSVVDDWQQGVDYHKGALVTYKEQIYTALTEVIAATEFNTSLWKPVNKSQIKTGLLPNFATNAASFQDVYDPDSTTQGTSFDILSNGIIGFRERNYLSDLGLDTTSQLKFYQGFIKNKGTNNAINALTTAKFDNTNSEIKVYEEWAIRVGEYGAVDSNQSIDITLDESQFNNDPATMVLLPNEGAAPEQLITVRAIDLYRKPVNYSPNVFLNRDEKSRYGADLPNAGYVNINDVDATLYSLANVAELNSKIYSIGNGYKVWVAQNFSNDWDIYRVTETQNFAISVTYTLDDIIKVETPQPHGMVTNDVVCIRNFDSLVDGVYQVIRSTDIYHFDVVAISANASAIRKLQTIKSRGILLKFVSMRFDYATDILSFTPMNGWESDDKVWIDNFRAENEWAVFNKTDPWAFDDTLTKSIAIKDGGTQFGYSIRSNNPGDILLVACPEAELVKTFSRPQLDGRYIETAPLLPQMATVAGFGKSLDIQDFVAAIGAPDSASNAGYAFAFNFEPINGFALDQLLVKPGTPSANSRFGHSVSLSGDNDWLYISAPGEDKVYIFQLITNGVDLYNGALVSTGTDTTYHLYTYEAYVTKEPTTIFNISAAGVVNAPVYVNDILQTRGVDYTRAGRQIEFAHSIPSGYVVRIGIDEFVPVETNALIVTGIGIRYIPGVDYNIVPGTNQLNFTTAPTTGIITVKQGPYYKHFEAQSPIESPIGEAAEFGCVVKSSFDGSRLVIGASQATVNGAPKAGRVFVYDKSAEQFISTDKDTFLTTTTLNEQTKVFVNNELAPYANYTISDNAVIFKTAPGAGAVIRIETNQYTHLEEITSDLRVKMAEFGTDLDLCKNDCALYVGAPGYSNGIYRAGGVARWFNSSRTLGSIMTGALPQSAVTAGDSIRINDFPVHFSGTGIIQIVETINMANLPGIRAEIVDDVYVKISSTSTNYFNKLRVSPHKGTAYYDLGFKEFTYIQDITRPTVAAERFGSRVKVNDKATTMIAYSPNGSAEQKITYDETMTTFDNRSTRFVDFVDQSGAVHVYEVLEDPYTNITNSGFIIYGNALYSANIKVGDQFGQGIDIKNNVIFVGMPQHDGIGPNSGYVATYSNKTKTPIWNPTKAYSPRVDVDSINGLIIYDKTEQKVIERLDYIDPAKGKILGAFDQYIDYKTPYDPAMYNRGSNINTDFHWAKNQVGKVWWNLDKVRVVDYEQDTLAYRSKNWGMFFPGSTIEIAEWVESSVPPSQYVSMGFDGVPLYPNDTAYVQTSEISSETNLIITKYYFWVTDKTSEIGSIAQDKRVSIKQVADGILNPDLQDIPYAAIIRDDAISLYNVSRYLSGTNVALQVKYDKILNTNIIHNEWELVQESNSNSAIPERIIQKLIDSLAGADYNGNAVPDSGLSEVDKIGILIRPRQTLFVNRTLALKNLVKYVNNIFANKLISQTANLDRLYQVDPVPSATTGLWNLKTDSYEELGYLDITGLPQGYRVLVVSDSTNQNYWTIYKLVGTSWLLDHIQTYKTTAYWEKIDWYLTGFDSSRKIDITVETVRDLSPLTLVAGKTIKVKNLADGLFAIYRVTDTLALELVGLQNGTLRIKDNIYDLSNYRMSWDYDKFDNSFFDLNPSKEIRNVLNALRYDLLVGDLSVEWNKLFFFMVNYILSEQKSVDWVFKTSFISILHKLRTLEQFPYYINDNQDYYREYIEEVKPYRTQIRDYILDYQGTDTINSTLSDFDLPPYYDSDTGTFRSPNGEIAKDATTLTKSPYSNWANNYSYSIGSVTVGNVGGQFYVPPEVTVTGGGGTGANLRVVLAATTANAVSNIGANASSFTISHVEVVNPGYGYTTTPTITINGTGVNAKLYPVLTNSTTRKIKETMQFDRKYYHTTIGLWQANTAYLADTVVAYNGAAYKAKSNTPARDAFDFTAFTVVPAHQISNVNDRILAYYQPLVGMPAAFITTEQAALAADPFNGNVLLVPTTTMIKPGMMLWGGQSTFANVVTVSNPNVHQVLTMSDSSNVSVTSGSTIQQYANNKLVATYSVVYDSSSNLVAVDLVSGSLANSTANLVINGQQSNVTAVSSISVSEVTVDNNQPDIVVGTQVSFSSVSLNKIISGISYPGTQVQGLTYDRGADTSSIDTSIQSTFLDSSLGIRPEDINIEGGAYYDKFSSYAPEELVPGVMYDSLSLTVLTDINNGESTVGYRDFTSMNQESTYHRISGDYATKLAANLNVTDTTILVEDVDRLVMPDPDNTVPGIVFINGEKIYFYNVDFETHTLSNIRRGVHGTSIRSVHEAGAEVVDASTVNRIPGYDNGDDRNTMWLDLTPNVVATTTATVFSSNSTAVVASTTGIKVGQFVLADGVPTNAQVTSIAGSNVVIKTPTVITNTANKWYSGAVVYTPISVDLSTVSVQFVANVPKVGNCGLSTAEFVSNTSVEASMTTQYQFIKEATITQITTLVSEDSVNTLMSEDDKPIIKE